MGEPMMDPRQVEDRALKNILRPNDFGREVEIPRARVKRFPSNVSNFKRSASARLPSRQNSFPGGNDNNNNYFPKSNPFHTQPIDIATLLNESPPAPKIPITSRGIGRSYSNRNETPTPLQQPNRQGQQNHITRSAAPAAVPIPNGGGSFLYSGNYDPNHPNRRIITKPVPLARSQSLNVKHAGPRPPTKPRSPRINNNIGGLKNPLAATTGGAIIEEDEVDGQQFDNWADDVYNNKASKGGIATVDVTGKKGKQNEVNSSPQQNWVMAGGPLQRGSDSSKPGKESFRDMARDLAEDQAKDMVKGLITEGEINPADMIGGIGGHLGGKAGGKLGAKIGKQLGNEEAGEQVGQFLGEQVGNQLGDMAQEAALDALGDLGGIEVPEIPEIPEIPEVPDASQLCSKCSVM